MSTMKYSRANLLITFYDDVGEAHQYECHNDFEEGLNEEGIPRESLPDGIYNCWAENPGDKQGESYGTFYIHTGDPRGRDIHGGGSSLPEPYAPYQGWLCTYGCLRMQNADGESLSKLIIAAGNNVILTVGD